MRHLIALCACVPALAFGQKASCPITLPQGSVAVVRAPQGWLGFSPSLARIDGAGMMSGPPKEIGYLVPSGTRKTQRGTISTWTFSAGEEKWLYCSYGTSAVQIGKRMDDSATVCELSYKKDEHGNIGEMVAVCKAQ
jgi:hypothetical protein